MSDLVARTDMPVAPTDFLTKLVLHQDFDPTRLEAAIAAWVRVQDYQRQCAEADRRQVALEAYLQAKAALQADLRPVERATLNPHTKSNFASLGDLWAACAPVWGRHGFAVDFDVREEAGEIEVVGYLSHQAGHVQAFHSYRAPPDTAGSGGRVNKTLMQGKQSAATYLQRNLLPRMVGIAMVADPADDDGGSVQRETAAAPAWPVGSPEERLARGDQDAVNETLAAFRIGLTEAAIETYLAVIREPMRHAPPHVREQVRLAAREALDRVRAQARKEQAAQPPREGELPPLLDPYGDTTGEVLDAAAWVEAFIVHWDATAKQPDERAALLQHNADALALTVIRAELPPDILTFMDAPGDDAVEAWVQEQVAQVEQADWTALQRIVLELKPKMIGLEQTHPAAYRRVKHVCEAQWAALKPKADGGGK